MLNFQSFTDSYFYVSSPGKVWYLNEIVATKIQNFSDATPVIGSLNFIVVGVLRYQVCSLPIYSLPDL